MTTYIPQPTVQCPDPPVYYTIRGTFTLTTKSGAKHVLPRAVSVFSCKLREYCVLDNIQSVVRIVYPPNTDVLEYEVFIYFPRAIRTYSQTGQAVPMCLPQLEDQCETLAEELDAETQPGAPLYEAILDAVNAFLQDPVVELTFCPFAYVPYIPAKKIVCC